MADKEKKIGLFDFTNNLTIRTGLQFVHDQSGVVDVTKDLPFGNVHVREFAYSKCIPLSVFPADD
jgi:hypothetical protein